MKQGKWKVFLFSILLAEGVGALSGWLTRDGVRQFAETAVQPPFSPPGFLFPVVWSILYALMGIGAAMVFVSAEGGERDRALTAYGLQLIVNFFWSLFFFNLRAYGFSFLWILLLLGLILLMIFRFRKVKPAAAWLQIPYLLWVAFATVLTCSIWLLNR